MLHGQVQAQESPAGYYCLQTQTELTLVTPYLVPTAGELRLLEDR